MLRTKREELPQAQARQRPPVAGDQAGADRGGGGRHRGRGRARRGPGAVADAAAEPSPRWRFSGRWWSKPGAHDPRSAPDAVARADHRRRRRGRRPLDGPRSRTYDGLAPGHRLRATTASTFRTLPATSASAWPPSPPSTTSTSARPICGVHRGLRRRPHPSQTEPGEDPYPEVMNRAAIAEIAGRRARRRRGQGRPHHPRDPGGVRRLPGPLRHGVRRPPAPRPRQPRRLLRARPSPPTPRSPTCCRASRWPSSTP